MNYQNQTGLGVSTATRDLAWDLYARTIVGHMDRFIQGATTPESIFRELAVASYQASQVFEQSIEQGQSVGQGKNSNLRSTG